jgi:hypothetical protein
MDWTYERDDTESPDLPEIIKTEREKMLMDQRRDGLAKWIKV